MKFKITNFRCIECADIELNGITILCGPNDAGKSSIEQALFFLVNSFHNLRNKALYVKRNAVLTKTLELSNLFDDYFGFLETISENGDKLCNYSQTQDDVRLVLNDIVSDLKMSQNVDKNLAQILIQKIAKDIFDIYKCPIENFKFDHIQKSQRNFFEDNVTNVFSTSPATLELSEKVGEHNIYYSIKLDDSRLIDFKNSLELRPVVFLGDDEFSVRSTTLKYYFSKQLERKLNGDFLKHLTNDEQFKLVSSQYDLDAACNILDAVCYPKAKSEKVFLRGTDKIIPESSLSSGVKCFQKIRDLVISGKLGSNYFLILDEPENYLHPAWQVKYAELIVLLYKAFGLTILLTSHSPYLIRGLQKFSALHCIADKTKFYLMAPGEGHSSVSDSTSCPDRIFKLLADPLNNLMY